MTVWGIVGSFHISRNLEVGTQYCAGAQNRESSSVTRLGRSVASQKFRANSATSHHERRI